MIELEIFLIFIMSVKQIINFIMLGKSVLSKNPLIINLFNFDLAP